MTRLPVLAALPLLALALTALTACGGSDSSAPETVVTVTQTVDPSPAPTETATSTTPIQTTSIPPVTVTVTPTPTPTTPTVTVTAPVTSSAAPVDLTKPPTTYDEALAHVTSGAGPEQAKVFDTPSGNIYCVLSNRYLPPSCELGEGAIVDRAYCGNGPASIAIGRIEYHRGRPQAVCNSDTIRGTGRATHVSYGTVVTAPGASVSCIVEEIGVTCVDEAVGNGFFLAKGTYDLF